jgi:hypothetical protein
METNTEGRNGEALNKKKKKKKKKECNLCPKSSETDLISRLR